MRRLTHRITGLGFVLFVSIGVRGDGATQPTTLASAPTGRISLQSLNLTAARFRAGTKEAAPATIWGDLSLPDGGGQVPAVILIHGSAGITGSARGRASHLPAIGIATFMVDSFGPRSISNGPTEQQLSRAGQVIDAYRAIELLVTHLALIVSGSR